MLFRGAVLPSGGRCVSASQPHAGRNPVQCLLSSVSGVCEMVCVATDSFNCVCV